MSHMSHNFKLFATILVAVFLVVCGNESEDCTGAIEPQMRDNVPQSTSRFQQGLGADFRCKCLCPASAGPPIGNMTSNSRDLMAIYLYGSYGGSDICLQKVPLSSLGGPFSRLSESDQRTDESLGGVSIYGDGKSLYAVTNLMKFRNNRRRAQEVGLIGMDGDPTWPANSAKQAGPYLLLNDASDLDRDSMASVTSRNKEERADFVSMQDYEKYLEEYLRLNPNALIVRSTAMAPHNSFRRLEADEPRNTTLIDADVVNQVLKDIMIHIIWLCIAILVSFTTVVVLLWRSRLRSARLESHDSWPIVANNANQTVSLSDGALQIGKITFHPKEIIGRGCSGTCVYRGRFEGTTPVAVKRVIADYVVLADREIDLLRSLAHPNLIRYFATEGDDQFRYIAIELAELTLSEYVEFKKMLSYELDPIRVCYESARGVAHLHSLNVIHRDLKPHNILISLPQQPTGARKVMISDFGVSKVVTNELSSLSSNLLSLSMMGTEGWIAPELIKVRMQRGTHQMNSREVQPGKQDESCDSVTQCNISKSADIFSLGCIFYYVLSEGKHPFGDVLTRQADILKGSLDLSHVSGEENLLQSFLIAAMLNENPSNRPPIEAIAAYPLFWDPSTRLQFLQDVSDRTENEQSNSRLMLRLEFGHFDVVRGDWRKLLTSDLQEDLRRFRSYRGSSVRDLLRALRNKKHHFRELPQEVQHSLGSIPNEFLQYFTSRFPRLLIHAYWAMQPCRGEHLFLPFYATSCYDWPVLPKSGLKWFSEETDVLMEQLQSAGVVMKRDDDESASHGSCLSPVKLQPNGSPVRRSGNIFSIDKSNMLSDACQEKQQESCTRSKSPFVKNKRQLIKQRRASQKAQACSATCGPEGNGNVCSKDSVPDLLPAFSRF